MLDTVVIRIHDLEAHETLCKFLNRKFTPDGVTVRQIDTQNDYSERQKRMYKTLLIYQDSGKMIEKAHFNKLKSSHYNIAYCIDYDRNFITLNLSIPKYIYGTNVVQFTRSPFLPGFQFGLHSEIDYNLGETFPRFMAFLKKFFAIEFGKASIYPKLVEINRVDLCFNQVFYSKASALEYMKQLKNVKKKHSRDTGNYSRDWKTSIVYKTDRYSFKVYHKGAEFKKHDAKELARYNDGNVSGHFDIPFLQDLADKTLRYELTVRGSYMSYLYMRHIFRKDCQVWQYGFKLYEQYRSAKDRKPTLLTPNPFGAFKKSLSVEDQRHINYVKHHLLKTKKFYLNVTDEEKDFDAETDHEAFLAFPGKKERFSYSSKFTPGLFALLSSKFQGFLKDFEISTFQDNATILNKLDQLNGIAQNKKNIINSLNIKKDTEGIKKPRVISRSKIVMILELLEKYTFEEIQANDFFHRNTWLRYRKDLELLGVTDKSLIKIAYNAPFNFRNYNNTVIYNKSKFRNLSFL